MISKLQSSYNMQQSLHQKLRAAQQYSQALEANFNNNLRVIEQFQQENEALRVRVVQLQQQNQSLRQEIVRQREERQLQKRIIENECSARVEQKQKETQEAVVMVQAKYRRQIQAISQKFNSQLKSLKMQLLDRQQSMRRVLNENGQLCTTISDLKQRKLNLEEEVASLNREKDAMSTTMKLHEQQLNGISTSHKVWEQTLKERIEVIKEEKRKIEQSFAEYKMIANQKIKRQKDDLARTLQRMADKQEEKFREAALEHKQLSFNLEKVTTQLKESKNEIERLKEQKRKMETNMTKYLQHEKAYTWNEKERAQLQQMLQQQKKDFQMQIKELTQKLKEQQSKYQKVNTRRQEVEKWVQRTKVEMINNRKEIERLQKIISKYQKKFKEYQQQPAEQKQPQANNYSKPQRAYDSKGFDFVQSVNMEIQQSKAYTDDPGIIDSNYFRQKQAKSPKHNNNQSPKAIRNSVNRQAQLMKQVSQVQLQVQDVRMANRRCVEQIDSLRRIVQDRKKQISLLKDKANIYWQKANDKEQQCNSLKELNSELRTTCSQLNQEIRRYKQSQSQFKSREQQCSKMKQSISHLQNEIKELNAEIQMLTKDRDLMEQISSDLRAQNHTLKEMIAGNHIEQEDNSLMKSQLDYSKSQQQFRQRQVQLREEQTIPFFQPQRQKIPKKLHDLVRQKKMLSISGKRAAIQQKPFDTRFDQMHAGTDSQKQVYQRIKQKNKTPPKVPNYNQMKKQKQRRSHQLQTLSQKQVYQRLKSRQNSQALNPPSPQRGVNYLQLRQLGAQ